MPATVLSAFQHFIMMCFTQQINKPFSCITILRGNLLSTSNLPSFHTQTRQDNSHIKVHSTVPRRRPFNGYKYDYMPLYHVMNLTNISCHNLTPAHSRNGTWQQETRFRKTYTGLSMFTCFYMPFYIYMYSYCI